MERSGTPALALLSATPVMTPVMTKERFAELVGVEVGVVRGMLDRGYLPTVKIGRHRLINLAALQAQCLARESLGICDKPSNAEPNEGSPCAHR
jgi:excisionase family DNA binding protein